PSTRILSAVPEGARLGRQTREQPVQALRGPSEIAFEKRPDDWMEEGNQPERTIANGPRQLRSAPAPAFQSIVLDIGAQQWKAGLGDSKDQSPTALPDQEVLDDGHVRGRVHAGAANAMRRWSRQGRGNEIGKPLAFELENVRDNVENDIRRERR